MPVRSSFIKTKQDLMLRKSPVEPTPNFTTPVSYFYVRSLGLDYSNNGLCF